MLALRITSDSLRNALAALFAIGIAPWFIPLTASAQDDLQPYTVYVDQEQVMARCGPGGDFYRTDELRHGQALEVYVETADHWLGIRPPDGSFSWLPADAVTLAPSQGFATIKEDHTIAWIGTHLGQASKYLWQVELSKGEEVAIIGRAKREGPEGVKVWYRIVPPAGEFRWVHRDQVVDSPELLLREKESAPKVARKSNVAVRPATFAASNEEPADYESDEAGRPSKTNRSSDDSAERTELRPLPRPEPDAVPLQPLRNEPAVAPEQGHQLRCRRVGSGSRTSDPGKRRAADESSPRRSDCSQPECAASRLYHVAAHRQHRRSSTTSAGTCQRNDRFVWKPQCTAASKHFGTTIGLSRLTCRPYDRCHERRDTCFVHATSVADLIHRSPIRIVASYGPFGIC